MTASGKPRRRPARPAYRHPVNRELYGQPQLVLLFNFDPFPFILLNLAFSTQAAYAAPLILLAGNRRCAID